MQQTTRRQTVSTMRALIFLCVFGWAVTAANGMTFNCNGCRGPLEGSNGTTNSSTVPGQNSSITVQKSEPTKASRVNWNGTLITLDNSLGFPKGTDNQNALNNTKAQNRNVACLGTRPRRRASPHASNWNPLQGRYPFKVDKDENQLNATDAVALNASDTTTNSSTTNEGDAQTERSKRDKEKSKPLNFWHILAGPGFKPEENDSQLNGTDVDPQNGSNSTTSSSTVSSTAKPRTRAKPTKPSSFRHPLKGPGFEAEENDSQTNE
ncbi:uncharacterized protein LOC105924726 [Fundulus heteroclitus]|uniref:uncharacterized protein LOC105924726 n=1 Tax=Fundulus heteroclitus TaxID=8078 RepID=UPI00165BB6CC|nr:uncharacterized protein LOC105924726 [Fundulus heteroclitus]